MGDLPGLREKFQTLVRAGKDTAEVHRQPLEAEATKDELSIFHAETERARNAARQKATESLTAAVRRVLHEGQAEARQHFEAQARQLLDAIAELLPKIAGYRHAAYAVAAEIMAGVR